MGAVNDALRTEMDIDSDVVVYGEDVGVEGGVFRATVGLQEEFGEDRCFDTPLGEAGIVGTALGMAVNGIKPVVEIQFSGFVYTAFNQLVNHVARMRNRTRGALSAPLVIRMPYGAGIGAPEHHMESMEALFGHIPGLKVVIPSTPYDAKGLLISAIRDPDPVIFMEPKRVYRSIRQEVPEEPYTIDIGRSRVVVPGSDLTLVSYGAQMREAGAAAAYLKKRGVSAELIDVRTIFPLDTFTIVESVKKTGKLLVVQEGPQSFGVAAEIVATVVGEAFVYLEAPPVRLTGADTIVPLAKSEKLYMIRTEDIVAEAQSLIEYIP